MLSTYLKIGYSLTIGPSGRLTPLMAQVMANGFNAMLLDGPLDPPKTDSRHFKAITPYLGNVWTTAGPQPHLELAIMARYGGGVVKAIGDPLRTHYLTPDVPMGAHLLLENTPTITMVEMGRIRLPQRTRWALNTTFWPLKVAADVDGLVKGIERHVCVKNVAMVKVSPQVPPPVMERMLLHAAARDMLLIFTGPPNC